MVLIISMLFTMTFVSFAEDGVGEIQYQSVKNQNEVTSVSNEESENTESLDNEESQKLEKSFEEIPEENKDNSEESLPDKKPEEETKEPEENKEPEKDLDNIFDGFDFGSIDIGKIGEILNPTPKENEENKYEGLKENPDKQSGEDPKEDQNGEGEIKTENSSTENQDYDPPCLIISEICSIKSKVMLRGMVRFSRKSRIKSTLKISI